MITDKAENKKGKENVKIIYIAIAKAAHIKSKLLTIFSILVEL